MAGSEKIGTKPCDAFYSLAFVEINRKYCTVSSSSACLNLWLQTDRIGDIQHILGFNPGNTHPNHSPLPEKYNNRKMGITYNIFRKYVLLQFTSLKHVAGVCVWDTLKAYCTVIIEVILQDGKNAAISELKEKRAITSKRIHPKSHTRWVRAFWELRFTLSDHWL